MHLATLIPFALVCLIIEITPGPNMIYLAILSMSHGRKVGFAAAAGAAIGLLGIGLITAFGIAAIITASTTPYQILRWSGVIYLLWLSWAGWHTEEDIAREKTEPIRLIRFFKRGLLTNILNPKAAVFYISVLPGFITESHQAALEATILTVIYVTIATVIHLSIVALAGQTHEILRHSRRNLFFRRILSLLLVFMAIWLAWMTRTP